ncbi:M50 family metallopeptidase [Oceanobacillus kapialis]|uniref:M50 family metallopeptidase n=1 Tax=Oceanobacillus kapialis TaxID=481353 RepID=A0ABW5PZE9_9BACI
MTIASNHLPKIHLHPILLAFLFISFLTGTFVEMAIIFLFVLIHELGHYAMAKSFNWRIDTIMLWVFGGVMKTDEHGTRPISEEFFVTIAGPFQHVLIYAGIFGLSTMNFMPPSLIDMMYDYNTAILLFNLLPLWPLDGGKLLFLLLATFLPYKRAYHTIILLSMLLAVSFIVLQLFLPTFTLSTFLIALFLFMENQSEWKQRHYVFMRFLIKRYETKHAVLKSKPLYVNPDSSLMRVFSTFSQEKRHTIYVVNRYGKHQAIEEQECLRAYFKGENYHRSIGELVEKGA